jgi:hypothetical protein
MVSSWSSDSLLLKVSSIHSCYGYGISLYHLDIVSIIISISYLSIKKSKSLFSDSLETFSIQ